MRLRNVIWRFSIYRGNEFNRLVEDLDYQAEFSVDLLIQIFVLYFILQSELIPVTTWLEHW